MARNITEAKRYLVDETNKIMKRAKIDLPLEVAFVFMRGETFAKATVYYKNVVFGEPVYVKVTFEEDLVRSNIYNIENPAFSDLIAHELSHVKDELIHKKSHGHRKQFRDIYKEIGGNTAIIGRTIPPDIGGSKHYYGGKGYGIVPAGFNRAQLKVCQACRQLGIYTKNFEECDICGGDLIPLRDVTPKEAMEYNVKGVWKGRDQEYLHERYGESIPKFQKARRNRSILDKAKTMTLGKRKFNMHK